MAINYRRDGSAVVTYDSDPTQVLEVQAGPQNEMDAAIIAFLAAENPPAPSDAGADPVAALTKLLIDQGVLSLEAVQGVPEVALPAGVAGILKTGG